MDSMQVSDNDENYFQINDTLELIEKGGSYHLLSPDGYVLFKSSEVFLKVDEDSYVVEQDDCKITVNNEEFEMIKSAIELCKGKTQ